MRILKKERGQSIVEFAFILPILLLLLGPVIDLGRAVYAKTQLQNITGDLLHMVILENEYSYQGGSFKAIEDKIATEEGLSHLSPSERDGYLIKKIFKSFVETEGLNKNGLIDMNNPRKYISMGPVKQGFEHTGHYPKLKKRTTGRGEYGGVFDEHGYDNKGYDKYGLDRLGYDRSGVDINNFQAGSFEAEHHKHERWELEDMETFDNSTYYREVTVTLPYEVKNITFTGKMLFGEKRKLEESVSGIIYMGGDGRDVTDPIS